MPEPERVDEPQNATDPVLTPAEDVPLPTPATPTEPTYHMAVWDDPPTYICQICNLQGVDKPTIVTHLDTAHGLPAIPTLIAQQVEDGILTPTLGIVAPPQPEEEAPDDERHPDDGADLLPGDPGAERDVPA